MAQCVFVGGGTRICSGSPYRVSRPRETLTGGDFPSLTEEMQKALDEACQVLSRALDQLEVPGEQERMARELMGAVLAVHWNKNKTANAADILKSVQLLLLDDVGDMQGNYTLVSYSAPRDV